MKQTLANYSKKFESHGDEVVHFANDFVQARSECHNAFFFHKTKKDDHIRHFRNNKKSGNRFRIQRINEPLSGTGYLLPEERS